MAVAEGLAVRAGALSGARSRKGWVNPQAPRRSYLSLLDWKERWIDGGRRALLYGSRPPPSATAPARVAAAADACRDITVLTVDVEGAVRAVEGGRR
ncbi:hypothetical protein [Streptomyces cupreus]|uniref:Uncharacterized protein n=1 Tax=Streptomyces cupreus TaxID=2759956 RepID=A0A7X1J0F9_9ACTN|nr:hypothetical protein [Streptomyces cupreus]MBC2901799.1 hypothetical protein [Streptomyces cupreus]